LGPAFCGHPGRRDNPGPLGPGFDPQGSTINSAVFSIYAPDAPTYQTVRLHRVTADWGEYSVTWATFAKSYDPAGIGSFAVNSTGWQTVDVTLLVQAW